MGLMIVRRSLGGVCYGAMAGFSRLCDVFVTHECNCRSGGYSESFYRKCKDGELAGKAGSPNCPPFDLGSLFESAIWFETITL